MPLLAHQSNHVALRRTAHRPGEVAPRRGGCSARQHETVQRFQAGVETVDGCLQPRRLLRLHPQPLPRILALRLRHTQVGAHVEQVVLNAPQQRRLGSLRVVGQHQAENGVQFIDAAVSDNAGGPWERGCRRPGPSRPGRRISCRCVTGRPCLRSVVGALSKKKRPDSVTVRGRAACVGGFRSAAAGGGAAGVALAASSAAHQGELAALAARVAFVALQPGDANLLLG